ncbi:flagellar export protein FliJ [Anaeromicropila populeti]|uniref:Flagellar FliJ protein n=1 Tax=Anaeromicropila populeti TaxID=37658 RepID=A0A1I6KX89_9FIRM|nr:flagellar export protein FliJ [Anaeromicropila populeti]SFR95836.1 flagellar FliJ protein [Anaeromicropila populeti]
MAKFFYKMQDLLNIKLKLEEQKRAAYGAAKRHLDEEEEKFEQLSLRKQMMQERLTQLMTSHINVMEVKRHREALKIIMMKMDEQKIAVIHATRQLELARITLNEAMKERKTHEKLKEKAFEAFKMELLKAEGKEVDELVSFKFSKAKDEED